MRVTAEHIGCLKCDSPYCDGCNLKTLEIMLHEGKFDCLMDDNHSIKRDADVVEERHGKWISASQKKGVNIGMKCSLCGARIKYSEFFNGNHNYCHKCSAKMDGKW